MLSLILPTRNWPADRIDACVRSFLRLKSKTLTEIVIVDFGSAEPVKLGFSDRRCRIVRVEAERWSLAEAINTGVVTAQNPVVAKTDADIVVAGESGPGLDAAVADLMRGAIGSAVVQATDLPAGIDAATALAATTATLTAEGRLRARWGQGGLCVFTVDVWNEIGGFESRYTGWGNEDNDFADRIRRSGRKVRWLKPEAVRIFHVWHPPQYAAKDIVKARTANQQIYAADKSTYRPIRFMHSRKPALAAPNLAHAPRPLVTVAFASKAREGRERMLAESIRGFVGQIDNDFEVLIADNGSTPEESATLRRMLAKLPRRLAIRVIDIDKPSIPGARNRITEEARGRYICVADDDDIPLPTRLADHLACFSREPGIHGSHGGWIDFDELTGIIDYNTGGTRLIETMMYGRGKVTGHPSSFYRRDVMQAVPYDESFKVGSDLDMALRMTNMGFRVAHTESYVTLRRFHAVNVTVTDLAGQVNNGAEARTRIGETFGLEYELRLRDLGKQVEPKVPCRNALSKDQVIAMIPGYCGRWRLLVPLSTLGKRQPAPFELKAGISINMKEAGGPVTVKLPNGEQFRTPPDLLARATDLAALVDGDVGVVDCGIDPQLHYVSNIVKGAKKALQLKHRIEQELDLPVEMLPDVEYERRRMTRFDWSRLARGNNLKRLVSRPIRGLDNALLTLAKVPNDTALRAMTSILADFNCTDQLYHLVTAPIQASEGPAVVKKMLEKQTGERFHMIGEADLRPQYGQAS